MATPAHEPTSTPPAARRRRRWIAWLLGILAVVVLLAVAAFAWLFYTSSGARFALEQAGGLAGEGVRIEGVEGRLGGELRIERIEVDRPDLYASLEDVTIDTAGSSPLGGGRIQVNKLAARRAEVRTPPSEEKGRMPPGFELPAPIEVEEARIGELRLGEITPAMRAAKTPEEKARALEAARAGDQVVRDIYVKGAGRGDQVKIEEARAQTDAGSVSLSGTFQTQKPFRMDARARIEGRAQGRRVEADVSIQGNLAQLEAKAEGAVDGQPLTARARLTPFADTPLAALSAQAEGVDLSKLVGGPKTSLSIDADLSPQGEGFAGPVRVTNADPGRWDLGKLPITAAEGRVSAQKGRVTVAGATVQLLGGGTAKGSATFAEGRVTTELEVGKVDLSALHGELQPTQLSGTVKASGDEAAQRFEVALSDPRFGIEGRGRLAAQRLELATVTLRTGGGSLAGEGWLALGGDRTFHFEGRGRRFDPSAFVKAARGQLNFQVVADGRLAEPMSGEVRLELAPSTYAGQPLSGHVRVAGSLERIASADVLLGLGEARASAKGSFGRPGDSLAVTLRAPSLAPLGRLAGVTVSGRLQGEGRLTGSFRSPAGEVSLEGGNLALPGNVFVGELALKARAGTEATSPLEATLRAANVAIGEEKPPTPLAEAFTASIRGTRAAHRLEAEARMTREATARAVLEGGLDEGGRALAWEGRLQALSLTGRGAFSLAAPTPLFVSASRIEAGQAMLSGTWGEARIDHVRWTPRSLSFKGSSPGIRIQNLARSLRLDAVPRSDLVIALDWNVEGGADFDARLQARRVSGDLRVGEPPLPLGLTELALDARSVDGRAEATLAITGTRAGRVNAEARARIVRGETGWEIAPGQPVEARITAAHTNLEALSPWLGPDARLAGKLDAMVTVSGTGADPHFSGEASASGLAVREPASGFEMENGELAVRLTGQSVAIQRFTASTPWRIPPGARESFRGISTPEAGTLTAEGGIDLGARTGTLVIRADKAVLTRLPSRFVAASGEVRIGAEEKGVLVTARLEADAGWIGALDQAPPSVSEDVVVIRAEQPPKREEGGVPMRLDARISLGESFHFEGRGLDTQLEGEIRVTGTLQGGLRAQGAIRTAGGTYQGYGQTLTIERGVLQFNGPLENPRLDVLAVRKGLPVEPGVAVAGSVARPRVRLVSTPDVPDPEKLSWLVLGRGPSDLAPGDASVLLAAATSMLGRGSGGTDFAQRFGLDEVRIGRANTGSVLGVLPQSTVAGRTGTPSAAEVVSVGKRLTRNLQLNYEQGLGDAEGALKLAWQITRHFQLLVRAGYLPGLDAVYRWTFK